MSQPPQNPWGQPSSDGAGDQNPYGASSPYGQQEPYGQPAQPEQQGQLGGQQGQFGSGEPYGQPSAGSGWQSSASDAPSAPGFGQPSANGQGSSFTPAFGGAPQGGEPPKKGNGGKIALFVCIGCAVLALLLVLVGGGIFLFSNSGGGSDPTTEPATTSAQPTDEQTSDPVTEDASTDATTEEATTEDGTTEASGGKGTKDSPYAIGETFTLDDGSGGTIDVTVGEVNWEATDEVMKANQFNEEPEDGSTYILVPLTVTYHGDDSLEPIVSLTEEYVTPDGNSFSDAGTVTPHSSLDVGTLYDGGKGEWEVGIIIPADQAKKGSFKFTSLMDFSGDGVWVKAA